MRTFDDSDGKRWDAAVLSGSYGDNVLIFSPAQGDTLLGTPMRANTLLEAEAQLADMDENALRSHLAEARPWNPQSGQA